MNRIPVTLIAAAFGLSLVALADTAPEGGPAAAPPAATAGATPVPGAAAPAAGPSKSELEVFVQKVKADKKLVVSQNLKLTDDEAVRFWPVYDEHQAELKKVNERLTKNILTFADAYQKGTVDNATAKKLIEENLEIEAAETRFKRPFVSKLEKILPMTKAARYLQIENKIRAAVRMELAAGIPLVD